MVGGRLLAASTSRLTELVTTCAAISAALVLGMVLVLRKLSLAA